MIEIKDIDGTKTAIVRSTVGIGETFPFAKIESLWIKPETEDFSFCCDSDLPNLRKLYIAKCTCPLDEMLKFRSLRQLRSITISESEPVLAGISSLGALLELRSLTIRRQFVREEVASWISQQPFLVSLALTDTNIEDSDIAGLQCYENLRRLDLFRSDISFTNFPNDALIFENVRSLDISQTSVSSDAVGLIEKMFPNLERLICGQTKIDRLDLARIATWDNLRVLDSGISEFDFSNMKDNFWDL